MIPYDPLQQLLGLDKASPQFHEQLHNFLRGDAYRDTLPNLQNESLTSLVEYLDNVSLHIISLASISKLVKALVGISDCAIPVFRDCLRELKNICGDKEVLPKPWTLSESLLGCVYKGTFNGSKVRIRRVRMHSGGDPRKVKEVCTLCHVPLFLNQLITPVGLPQGGRNFETLRTSEHCPPLGCDHGSSRTHFRLGPGRGPSAVHRKAPRCKQTFSREYSFHQRAVRHTDSLTSYLTSPRASIISIFAM